MLNQAGCARTQRGASLVELAIGFVLLGILLTLAVPSFSQFLVNQRVRANAEAVLNGFQLARSEALRRNARVVLTTAAGGAWTIGCQTVTSECAATLFTRGANEAIGDVTLAPTPAAATKVTFTELGGRAATNADASALLTGMQVSTLLAGARTLRVEVSGGGSIRMCDPNLPGGDARAC